jgi:hypothetical protein
MEKINVLKVENGVYTLTLMEKEGNKVRIIGSTKRKIKSPLERRAFLGNASKVANVITSARFLGCFGL